MTKIKSSALMLSGTVVLACSLLFAQVQRPGEYPRGEKPSPMMNFFVTSEPIGDGGNLGGLAGADAHCQTLATAVGAGNRTWHAYLSTQARPGKPAVNARDRIGKGPWYNFRGEMIAQDLAHLHGDTMELAHQGNNLNKLTGLTEKGQIVPGLYDYTIRATTTGNTPRTPGSPAGMKCSPVLSPMAPLSPIARITPAITGPATRVRIPGRVRRRPECLRWQAQRPDRFSRPQWRRQRFLELRARNARLCPGGFAENARPGPVLLLRD